VVEKQFYFEKMLLATNREREKSRDPRESRLPYLNNMYKGGEVKEKNA